MKKVAIAVSFLSLIGSALTSCVSTPLRAGNNNDRSAQLSSVAVAVRDLGNPFFVQIGKGAQASAKKIGGSNVRTTIVSSGDDLNQQFNQIENFIASDVSLIILNAADSKGIFAGVEKAKAAGIPIVAVDTAAEGGVDATVTSNNVQAGEVSCKYIADRLKGKGEVVIINGPPVNSVVERINGCLSVFAKYPNIKILSKDQNAEGSRDGGLRVMSDLLTSFRKIDAVFAINDPTAIGAELAAKQAKRSEFFIVGVDGAPEALDALRQNNSLVVATAAQDPFSMAAKAVEVGNNILKGNKPANPNILIPVTLITRENVNQHKGWTSE